MKIDLNDSEIKKALVSYVENQGIDLTGLTAVVNMVAGRGNKGYSASIDFSPSVSNLKEAGSADTDNNDETADKSLFK